MNLPHLTFLRSFEAAARHLSFTSAAQELNCTQSAVSNHVRSLEEFIKRPLFVRHPRSLSLTDVGKAYLPSVRRALQDIDAATRSLVQHTHSQSVVVSCPISLAGQWLPGVIKEFSAQHPNIALTIHGTIWTDVEPDVSDISITIDHEDDVGEGQNLLWVDQLTVVAAPGFVVAGEPLTQPKQLEHASLIHILGRSAYWKSIASHWGLEDLTHRDGARANASSLAVDMAASGYGCVAVPRSLAQAYIERGQLVEPFDLALPSPWSYQVNTLDKTARPAVKLFHDGLLASAAKRRGQAAWASGPVAVGST